MAEHWRRQVSEDLSDRRDEAPVLAACGYAARAGLPPGLSAEQWREGVRRLSQRDPASARRDTFLYRPLDVLGIGLGLAAHEEAGSPAREWFRKALIRADPEGLEPNRTRNLLAAAASVIGEDRRLTYPGGGDLVELAYWWVLSRIAPTSPSPDEIRAARRDILLAGASDSEDARTVADVAAVGSVLEAVVRDVVEAVVEEFEEPAASERREAEVHRITSLQGAVGHAERRAQRWGKTYTIVSRVLLLPFAVLLPLLVLFGVAKWAVDEGLFRLPLHTVVGVLMALGAVAIYVFVRDWEKAPANLWPRRLGLWKEKRIRHRWLGSTLSPLGDPNGRSGAEGSEVTPEATSRSGTSTSAPS